MNNLPLAHNELEVAQWRAENKTSWAKWHDEAMKELLDAKATGVIMGPYDTNIGLAGSDYSQRCTIDHKYDMDEQGCLLLYNGYWIWWCKTHYQPMPWCDLGKLQEKLTKVAKGE